VIVLTGAAGVVGSTLVERLDESSLVCVSHRRPVAGGARVVDGDVAQPRLGLAPDVHRELCARAAVVIHAAATVTFKAPPEEYARTNVEGTRNAVRLAEEAGARLVHVSTAFVRRARRGNGLPATYEESKLQAEEIVRASAVPHAIVRPSIVVGDSRTGDISTEQGIYQAVATLVDGPVRVVPGEPEMLIDFVPRDHVADAILAAATASEPPSELWVTSGDAALRLGDFASRIDEFVERQGIRGERVRTVPYERVERLFLPIMPPQLQRDMRRLLRLARYVNTTTAFPTSTDVLERAYGIARPQPPDVFTCNLEAWWERRARRAGESTSVAGSVQR
jgi:nucleoside-diphosphate-sugar epimerase